MIGDDDRAIFFDPEVFGVVVRLHVPGEQVPREINGKWSKPAGRESLKRDHTRGAGLRVAPDERPLQVACSDLPDDWRNTRVVVDEAEHAIGDVVSLGRLRAELILTPWQERSENHVGWLRS